MELPLPFPSLLFIWLVFASADEEQQVQPPVLLPDFVQGTSNVNLDFWQTCAGMRVRGEGERHSFSGFVPQP